tara:strand:- start:166 stop:1341 length:1176 start_codon:yes stop_codon:yes gene_type:complete
MSNVIVSFSRTPIGSFLGALSSVSAPNLGATAIKGALEKISMDPKLVNQVILGNVLSAGLGQAPARQAAIFAGLEKSVQCLTINKMCGSGLQSVIIADQIINNNPEEIIVAGGMESMSQSPHYLLNSRTGNRLGDGKLVDGMVLDGLWDVYNDKHMGNCAEMCAKEYNISREDQDEYAIASYQKSQNSMTNNIFSKEITSIEVPSRKEMITVSKDEEPHRVKFDKIKSLKPVFDKNGTVTAANASTINDGAAICVVMSEKKAQELGLVPIAEIINCSSFSHSPEWFTTAPVFSIKKLLKDTNIDINEIDLFEINEAFSVVTLSAIKNLNIDPQKVNIYGGSVSLGHPIGASGARILCTLLNALTNENQNQGIASICIGGGEASSILVRRLG